MVVVLALNAGFQAPMALFVVGVIRVDYLFVSIIRHAKPLYHKGYSLFLFKIVIKPTKSG